MLVGEMTFLRDEWHAVAVAADLAGPRAVRLLGRDLVVWRGDGGVAVSDPFCPHRSAHLATGWVEDGRLVCPYHGWRFETSGECSLVPQMRPDLPTPAAATLRTHPAVERYGMVWTCLGDPATDGPPPWPEADDAARTGWRVQVEFFEEWRVAAPRIIDNNLDNSHVAYVHRSTFGDPDDARLPSIVVEATERGFVSRLVTEQPGIGVQLGVTDDESRRFRRTTETELLAPLTTRTRMHYGGAGPDYCFYSHATPIDDDRSMYLRLSALSGTEEEQPWVPFHEFGRRVKDEDRFILETTRPDFPVDVTSEVHLRSDKPTLEYRRHLARCVDAHDPRPATLVDLAP